MYVHVESPSIFLVYVLQWYWLPKAGPCSAEWQLWHVTEPNGCWWGQLAQWEYLKAKTFRGATADSVTNIQTHFQDGEE